MGEISILANEHNWDRSGKKKTILVVSLDGPAFDKSTACRMTFHYLKLFLDMGLHVIYAGQSLKRLEPYASVLEQLGIQVLYGNSDRIFLENWIKKHAKYIDYAYLIFPFIAEKYIDVLKKYTKAKILYNASDLFYLRVRRNYELERDPKLLVSSENWKKIEFNIFNKADVLHVVSGYEQDILKRAFPNKKIRNIPVYIYENHLENITPFEKREGLLFVGTFTHKPNVDGVLWFIRNIYPLVLRVVPDMKFYIVGLHPPDVIMRYRSKNIMVTGHVTDQQLEDYYSNCRLVVAPLRFGAGVKGKIVEAMHYQVPVVTTSIGAEGLLQISNYMMIADQPKDFTEKLIEAYCKKELWNKLSVRSKTYIDQHFSVVAARKQLETDILP